MTILGYTHTGWSKAHATLAIEGRFHDLFSILNQFDGCRDVPWAVLYREIDVAFPRSLFLLTVRNPLTWMNSMLRHFNPNIDNPRLDQALVGAEFRRHIFGSAYPCESPDQYLIYAKKHNEEVLRYFGARVLTMDLENGDGWDKLCPYIGRQKPTTPFPHVNRSNETEQINE